MRGEIQEVRLRSQFVSHPFVIVFDSGNVVCVAGTPQKFGGYNGIQCVEKNGISRTG